MIWITSAETYDCILLNKLKLDSNTIYVFDKEYNDFKTFKLFEKEKSFLTSLFHLFTHSKVGFTHYN